MNAKYLLLAAEFLETFADELSAHGCNDYELPPDWDAADRAALGLTGNPHGRVVMDWDVAGRLAEHLAALAALAGQQPQGERR